MSDFKAAAGLLKVKFVVVVFSQEFCKSKKLSFQMHFSPVLIYRLLAARK
jgi:hypothetical protein